MRLCPHCKRMNPGRPDRCHYCGRTWHLRLCPWGHPNPYDAAFCGRCGSADLSQPASTGWTGHLLKAGLGLACLLLLLRLVTGVAGQPGGAGRLLEALLTALLPVAFLLAGVYVLFASLPRFLRLPLRRVPAILWRRARSRGGRDKKEGRDLGDFWTIPPFRGSTGSNTGRSNGFGRTKAQQGQPGGGGF